MSERPDNTASEPRVPVFLLARHKNALSALARSFGCPETRLLDEAVAHYLKQLERLGVMESAPARAEESEAGAQRRVEEIWSAVLR